MRLLFEIALTHIRGRVRQTALAMLGVATGVGFAVAMAALMQGSQQDFIQRIFDASPHVVIRDEYRAPPAQPLVRAWPDGAVALSGVKPKDELRGIRNPQPKLAALAALPGVVAAPSLRGQVVLRYGAKDVAVALIGIEPRLERRVSQLEQDLIEGSLDALYTTADGIILGSGLARKLAARHGASLVVSSPSGAVMRAKVIGLSRSGIVSIDDNTAYARIKAVQALLDRPNVVNEIRLKVADLGEARPLAQHIERRFGYRTDSWEDTNDQVLQVFRVRNTIMYATVAAILVVASFGIFNIVSTITYEKSRDIAILRSLGFAAADVRAIFLSEGVVIGLAGTVAGWVLGFALTHVLAGIEIRAPHLSEPAPLPVVYDLRHYAIAGAVATISALVACYLPASRAARLDPVAIVRGAT
jgi:lipoprotein-releasing system permease protein